MLTRRDFAKTVVGGAIGAMTLDGALVLTSCNSTIFDNILSWIPLGISAVTGIVTVLDGLVPPEAQAVIALIKASFADLSATIVQYQNDQNPADKMTLLAKIRTILNDIVENFQGFLAQLNIGNSPIEAIVLGLASVVISAIEGFIGQLPGPTVAATSILLNGKRVNVTPHLYKSTGEFVKAYNTIAENNGHPEVDLH